MSLAPPAVGESEVRPDVSVGTTIAPPAGLAEVFERYRFRLKQLIRARLGGRLRQRFDASDVIQEAFVRADARAAGLGGADISEFLWVRRITLSTLVELQRRHLGVRARDVRLEQEVIATSDCIAAHDRLADRLVGSWTSPLSAVQLLEEMVRVQRSLEQLDPIDREILVLRHMEQRTRAETAEILGISVAAAAKRYVRAVSRCRVVMRQQGLGHA